MDKKIRKNLYEKEKWLESENEKEKIQHVKELKKTKNFLEGFWEEIQKKLLQTNKN